QQHSCSFDHLVGAPGKGEWEGDAEGFGCLQIDQQLDFRDLLHRQIGRLVALEDASGIDTSLTVGFHKAASVAHQPTGESEVARWVDGGHGGGTVRAAVAKKVSEATTRPLARSWSKVANTASKSLALLACRTWSCNPSARAASCRFLNCESAVGLVGLRRTATTVAVGIASRKISRRLGVTSTFKLDTPVRLPPGRFRLVTSPIAIGSAPISNTMGMAVVTDFAAIAAGAPPGATITATRRATSSAASAGNRSC